jgi:Na+-driven multidrug efflux pump
MSDPPRKFDWFLRALGWDSCLPLVVVGSRLILKLFAPDDVATAIAVFIVMPVVAIMRAKFASAQVAHFGLKRHWGRQLVFAAAIVAMTLCEIICVFLLLDPTSPGIAWVMAAMLFGLYVSLITIALRPLSV